MENRLVERVRLAKSSPIAAVLGAALGGFVPTGVWRIADSGGPQSFGAVVAHLMAPFNPSHILLLGGLLFSAKTVFLWGRETFGCPWKAGGLAVFLEGSMSLVPDPAMNFGAYVLLALINLIDAAAVLAAPSSKRTADAAAPTLPEPAMPPLSIPSDASRTPTLTPRSAASVTAETSAHAGLVYQTDVKGGLHDSSSVLPALALEQGEHVAARGSTDAPRVTAEHTPTETPAHALRRAERATDEVSEDPEAQYERVLREVVAHDAYSARRLENFVPCSWRKAEALMRRLASDGVVGEVKSSPCGGRKVLKRVATYHTSRVLESNALSSNN